MLAYQRSWPGTRAQRGPPVKSIAVLPFENFSEDKANAFFADGIQDDVLTNLAKIKDLKVISRTSVMSYRDGAAKNLREIGAKLGVAAILEGSVRRDGNRVVVNVQLIDALKDRHLWANRYDRTLADSLGLQGELAKDIADALSATLSPEEKKRVEAKPTENADAYVLYLRARQFDQGPDLLLENLKRAEELYTEAISLDPNFALAHARLASVCAEVFHFHDPLESWKNKARAEAEKAHELQHNLGEAHFALGQCLYFFDRDYDRAIAQFNLVQRLIPNSADAGMLIAAIKRRQGHWQESLDELRRAQTVDPQNPNVVRNLIFTNTALRQWKDASAAAQRLRAMAPDAVQTQIQGAYVDFWRTGQTTSLRETLARIPAGTDPDGVVTSGRWDTSMIDRNLAAAENAVRACALDSVDYLVAESTPKNYLQGCIDLARGDTMAAQRNLDLVRDKFETAVSEAPANAERHANLGLVYAFLARKADAIREGRRAVELKPESKDAFDGVIMNCYLALIYARIGESDLALALIERLLKTPGAVDSACYSMTTSDLRRRWEWDPLRKDPRFEKILAAAENNTTPASANR